MHRLAVRTLLARWRAAERRLGEAPRGTAEWERAHAAFEAARRAYLDEMENGQDTEGQSRRDTSAR